MRPHEIFAAMTPERAEAFFGTLSTESPAMFDQAVLAAAAAMKSRPKFLMKQPITKRVAAVRRALARVAAGPVAEEMLAVYFLECRKAVLTEWLDLIGLDHEEGTLKEPQPAQPPEAELEKHVATYLTKDDDPDRELLLQAFGAQSSIDWPMLDGLIAQSRTQGEEAAKPE
jgi:hypothetical protein